MVFLEVTQTKTERGKINVLTTESSTSSLFLSLEYHQLILCYDSSLRLFPEKLHSRCCSFIVGLVVYPAPANGELCGG